jgi:BirA family transcriptional regulator, biotin operon repressor / biotin---[acetyl-CoA-carboxylase] ligase
VNEPARTVEAELAPVLEAQLTTRALARSRTLLADTASTNDDAREAALAGAPHGHLVLADTQSRGRGSRGRSWSSPAGSDLYFSLVVRHDLPLRDLPPITLAVGVAVACALDPLLGGGTRSLVKWPNDVWVGRKKLVGILVESSAVGESTGPLIVGIGVNVNRRAFLPELTHSASSVALECGGPVSRAEVLVRLLNELEPWLDRFAREGAAPVVAALAERLALRGERVTCEGYVGTVEGVAASGALLLRDERGVHALFSGTLRPCEEPSDAPA